MGRQRGGSMEKLIWRTVFLVEWMVVYWPRVLAGAAAFTGVLCAAAVYLDGRRFGK